MTRILISCGEASGDLYAGALAAEIRRAEPGAELFGFGGPHLRAAGARLVGDYRGFSVTGLAEAVAVVPRSWRMLRRLVAAAQVDRPSAFVAIDFPDFNFRLVRQMRRLGVPVVYYVSPQLWAWRAGRLRTIKASASKVLVIFPFEAEIYERAGVPVEFVGHPLVDLIGPTEPRASLLAGLGLDPAAPTIALLPGSRPNELTAILPTLADAARLVAARVPGAQFVVARATGLDDGLFAPVSGGGPPTSTVEGRTDDVLAAADVVVTASGTATVQTALHGKPMVIVYRLSPLTYRLGKPFVKVDTYGMVNLVAGRRVVPELIQDGFTAASVADETVSLITDGARRAEVEAALGEVRTRLGGPGASRRGSHVARLIEDRARETIMNRPMRGAAGLVVAMAAGVAAAGATVLLPADLGDLVRGSQAVVHGRVTGVRAEWVAGHRRIDSFVTVEASEYFKGDFGRAVTFRVPGGEIGRYRSITVGAPVFHAGDEVVLFLGSRGPSVPYVLGLSQGVFRVVDDPTTGRRLVTPPALVAGAEPVTVRRGDPTRRPIDLTSFGETVRGLASGAGGRR